MLAEGRFESFDGALLVAAARATANTDGADHLPVHYDRNAARVREETEETDLPRNALGIVLELHAADRRGLPRLQRGLRLEQRGTNVVEDLAIHALHVHELACIVDDVERHGPALRRRPVAAGA